jgi:hypothetical protein
MPRNFFRDQIETFPKTTLFTSAMKKERKKRGSVHPAKKKKCEKRAFVIFHGNCLKNKKQSVR